MKPASPELIALLQDSDAFLMADCFTFTLNDGAVLRYTTAVVPVTVGGQVFAADGPMVSGLKYKIAVGLDVDEQDITILARPTDLVGGVPFLAAMRKGVFDGATIQRERAFLASWQQPAVGSVILFHGRVSTIDKIGRTQAQLKVKSALVLLDIDMPRNIFQASCLHTLGDAGCGIDLAGFTTTGTVSAGSTVSVLNWSGEGSVQAQTKYYEQGTLTFTGGGNDGVQVTVKTTDDAGRLTLIYPLDDAPAAGDSFTICAGCDHSLGQNGCAKFNNTARFRGFPYVPPPETAY
jgi:uncharacterized phage protein (TIGR02218 family)